MMGESLTESLRNLELPKLAAESNAVDFGDWLALVGPLMADLGGTSSQWWALVLGAATESYAQWTQSTPLERLRLKVGSPQELSRWPRTEQRAVTMLLAAIPEPLRKDLISSRKLKSIEIIYALLCRYQPGGVHEKTVLLKDITENRLSANAGIAEVLQALRVWRRNLGRSFELGVQLPDALVLVGVLTKWSDQLGRLGGPQLVFRFASLRQELQLDFLPTNAKVTEFAEALQAEAEQLALAIAPSSTTSAVVNAVDTKKKEIVRVAALRQDDERPNENGFNQNRSSKVPRPCKFWGTTVGCRRGDKCIYEHSWDGIKRHGRCWNCSGEGHMKPECPYMKHKDGQKEGRPDPSAGSPNKVSKVTGPKNGTPRRRGDHGKGQGGDQGGSTTSTPTRPLSSSTSGPTLTSLPPQGGGVSKGVEEIVPNQSTTLVTDINGLVKSLQSIKAVHLRYVARNLVDPNEKPVALIDGGATHGLRTGTADELREAESVVVERARGTTTLYRKPGCSTLLAKEPIEPIVPMRQLVEAGYKVNWTAKDLTINHPTRGPIRCWRRQGCPVVDRQDGLLLLRSLEEDETAQVGDQVQEWWRSRFPDIPNEVLKYMKGQDDRWEDVDHQGMPFNRHRRRQLECSRGVILHLFSGGQDQSKKWKSLEKNGYMVLTLDVSCGAAQDLHNPKVWGYLCHLAKRGKIRAILGGPPCRTFSRLRHVQPGPRPLRGRGESRWGLPDLREDEAGKTHSDTALVLKQLGLFELTKEADPENSDFLMEHPEDPMEYLREDEAKDFPSVWDWKELREFAQRHGLAMVSFDQGRCGHVRRKPTTILTSLMRMKELDGMRQTNARAEPLHADLPQRMHQTAAWSTWAPGLVSAIKVAIEERLSSEVKLRKALSLDDWRQHVRQGHVPFRRDCRLCVEEMGQDHPHRRQRGAGGESVYVLSVDLTGPYVKGTDLGTGHKAKYMMVATVPVPLASGKLVVEKPRGSGDHGGDQNLRRAKAHGDKVCPGDGEDEKKGGDGFQLGEGPGHGVQGSQGDGVRPGEGPGHGVQGSHGDDVRLGEGPAHEAQGSQEPRVPLPESIGEWMSNPLQPVPELGDEFPDPEDPAGEPPLEWSEEHKKVMNQLNEKWKKHCEVCTEPVDTKPNGG